jgi:hypothetical protein
MGKVKRENRFLSPELAKQIIDTHSKHALVAILYFQGEPLLNPHWFEIVKYASEKKLFTILSTNGQFLDSANCEKLVSSGLNRLVVSADGTDQAVYEKYRVGGELDKIVDGLACLRAFKQGKNRKSHTERSRSMTKDISAPLNVRNRSLSGAEVNTSRAEVNPPRKHKTPTVVFQALITKDTESTMRQIKKTALEWGADKVEFKTMQIYDQSPANLDTWLPLNKRFQRKTNQNVRLNPKKRMACWRALTNAVYTTDGVLVPCCFDKLAEYPFGTIGQVAWSSGKRRMFIQQLAKGRISPSICHNCTEA